MSLDSLEREYAMGDLKLYREFDSSHFISNAKSAITNKVEAVNLRMKMNYYSSMLTKALNDFSAINLDKDEFNDFIGKFESMDRLPEMNLTIRDLNQEDIGAIKPQYISQYVLMIQMMVDKVLNNAISDAELMRFISNEFPIKVEKQVIKTEIGYGLTSKEMLKNYRRIFIVACGTAMHAGLVGKYVIEKMARVEVTVDIASEFRYRDPLIQKEDLVILISQSGETADTLAALKLAKERGATTMSVVNVKGSSIARESDIVVYTHAGPEISVASTKAYAVQLSIMYLLAFELAYAKGVISEEECRRLTKELENIPEKIEEILVLKERCQFIASRLVSSESLLYIGRGLDYALSMEGSLKLKEISYIHSESYAAGELKHGTISLITEDMPVIAVATQSDLFEKTLSNIKEVKARGAKVTMICREGTEDDKSVANHLVVLPNMDDVMMPMLALVPMQYIAYYTAVLKGCDVDKPRNLAKSVTVE